MLETKRTCQNTEKTLKLTITEHKLKHPVNPAFILTDLRKVVFLNFSKIFETENL